MRERGTPLAVKQHWMRDRYSDSASTSAPAASLCGERHYSVSAVADMWNLSRDVVRKLFEDEPGVLVLGNDGSRIKRGYHTLRIPESIMERVHRRLCNPALTVARSQA